MSSTTTKKYVHPNLVDFDGLLMPTKLYTLEKCRLGRNFVPEKDDVMICTYPKSGTTWMQYILWEILKNSGIDNSASSGDDIATDKDNELCRPKTPPHVHEMWFEVSKEIEMYGPEEVMKLDRPRIIKSHNPATYRTFSDNVKYINIYRNPWDTVISYYNNMKEAPQFFGFIDGTEYDAIECFLDGYLPWGDYFAHVTSWLKLSGRPNILILSYEELKTYPRESILKVSKFLGDKYETSLLANSGQRLTDILNRTSFDSMKKLKFVVPKKLDIDPSQLTVGKNIDIVDQGEHRVQNFFARGTFNYGISYFNIDQKKRMISRIRKTFENDFPEILDKWKSFGVAV